MIGWNREEYAFLQSLFVWILSISRHRDIHPDAFNPCSCGYYGRAQIDSRFADLQSLFVWILCNISIKLESISSSILVRVDIIEFNRNGIYKITFNPCSCGYYASMIKYTNANALQSLFVWILYYFSHLLWGLHTIFPPIV